MSKIQQQRGATPVESPVLACPACHHEHCKVAVNSNEPAAVVYECQRCKEQFNQREGIMALKLKEALLQNIADGGTAKVFNASEAKRRIKAAWTRTKEKKPTKDDAINAIKAAAKHSDKVLLGVIALAVLDEDELLDFHD